MIKNGSISKIKIMLALVALFAMVGISELVYTFQHPNLLQSYKIKSAQYVSKINTPLALFILTDGRVKRSDDIDLNKEIKNYLVSLPDNYDQSRIAYDLAVLASKSGSSFLIPLLLQTSINHDPHFSFWRVELANYYYGIGNKADAEIVLDDCMTLPAPSQYCEDYKNSYLTDNQTQNVGFLVESINIFYNARLH